VGGSTTGGGRGFTRGGPPPAPDFVRVNGTMGRAMTALDNADMAPTASTLKGYAADCTQLRTVITNWQAINTRDLPAFNAVVARANAPQIHAASPPMPLPACGAGLTARDRRSLATHNAATVSHSKADEDDGDEGGEPL
ncbi:MAG TPA: hypothetical protein VIG47_14035, partial [Gemmatimonadaceae bacterium]